MAWGLLFALFISILVFYTMFHLMRKIVPLLLNGVLGLGIFLALNYAGVLHIPMTWLTFLISGLGGILGVVAVIALTYFGIPL